MNNDRFSFLLKNWGFKLIAVVIAVFVWVYVLSIPNTERDKKVEGVSISFSGEAALNQERGLAISSNKDELLQQVNMVVSVNASNYSNIRSDTVRATIDLSAVATPGEHILRINATTPLSGTVKSVTPSVMKLQVDKLATRTIPVGTSFTGEIPEGYWNSDPELFPASVQVKGPQSELEKIASASCIVNLDGLSESVSESLSVQFYDQAGTPVSTDNFIGDLPSANVKMKVYPKKQVNLDIASALKGLDNVAVGYEVLKVEANPTQVEIAAPEAVLNEIDKLSVESVNLNNASESVISIAGIRKPVSSVILLSYDSTEIYVEIEEMHDELQYDAEQIEIDNLAKGLTAKLEPEVVNMTVTGTLSELRALKKGAVRFSINLAAYATPGTYTVPVDVALPEGTMGVYRQLSPGAVTVVIAEN